MQRAQTLVVGGGLVGMAVALGLTWRGQSVTVLDEGDVAHRASRGNFGLVWVQGKGLNMPAYSRWSRRSAALWPDFAARLREEAGLAVELAQPGGLRLFLSERELETYVAALERLKSALNGDYPYEILGHNAVKAMVPDIGKDVVAGSFSPADGHANPLKLLRALHTAFARAGGRFAPGATVETIAPGDGFTLKRQDGEAWQAEKIVLCAGLGNARLAPMVGLEAPVAPQRGQVAITEKVKPFLKYPMSQVRQVGEGPVQLGDSKEDVGFDDGTDNAVLAGIAKRATRMFPLLENVRIVRTWAALRIMSPDGCPIYDRSTQYPGAWLAACHSGVTLAAAHTDILAGWIAGEAPPQPLEDFSARRFALQTA